MNSAEPLTPGAGGDLPSSERPRSVTRALVLLYAVIALGFANAPLLFSRATAYYSAAYILFVWAFFFGVYLLLLFLIGKGRGWARITYLVVFIMSVPSYVRPLFESFSANRVSNLIVISQLVLSVAGFVLLFQRANDRWFRRPPTSVPDTESR